MIERRSTLALLAAAASTSLLPSVARRPAQAAGNKPAIAIIGTGEVGSALGKRWAALGYKIVYGSRTPGDDRVKALVKKPATALLPKPTQTQPQRLRWRCLPYPGSPRKTS